jgi:hypothetical protein
LNQSDLSAINVCLQGVIGDASGGKMDTWRGGVAYSKFIATFTAFLKRVFAQTI